VTGTRADELAGRHVLLLAPHPDDEVVGCCAAIGRARAAGAQVAVLYLTTGLPDQAEAWPWRRGTRHQDRVDRRRAEALEVAAALGVRPVGFRTWPSRTLRHHIAEARAAVRWAMAAARADRLWAPAYEGGHQDHDVANFIASTFASRVPVVEYATYNFQGRRARSNEFAVEGGDAWTLRLAPDEVRRKHAMLAEYGSERGNLRHIRLTEEQLRWLHPYDYTRPPHEGRLFYERFQWIPLRHPRVDATRGWQVCAALAAARAEPAEDVLLPLATPVP
jgi:LmbE family N-acetylglucosaminyl deacetylase